jgi:hypothetical protein
MTCCDHKNRLLCNPNDLNGISYLWGGADPTIGLDCWSYCSFVSECHGAGALDLEHPMISITYGQYSSHFEMPQALLGRLVKELLVPLSADAPLEQAHLAIALLESPSGPGLGTVLTTGDSPVLALMTSHGSRVVGWPMATRLGVIGLFDAAPLALRSR